MVTSRSGQWPRTMEGYKSNHALLGRREVNSCLGGLRDVLSGRRFQSSSAEHGGQNMYSTNAIPTNTDEGKS